MSRSLGKEIKHGLTSQGYANLKTICTTYYVFLSLISGHLGLITHLC